MIVDFRKHHAGPTGAGSGEGLGLKFARQEGRDQDREPHPTTSGMILGRGRDHRQVAEVGEMKIPTARLGGVGIKQIGLPAAAEQEQASGQT